MQQQQHSQRPEQITDADAFVAKVLAVQDPLRIDDDLEELSDDSESDVEEEEGVEDRYDDLYEESD